MKTKFVISFFTAILFTSCSPIYYVPNTQNVPLLNKKGQINLSLSGNDNQIEAQGAYAINQHLGLMLNSGFYIPINQDDGNGGSGKLGELGVGYFTPVSDHFVFETYGLVGYGSVENHLPSTLSEYPATTGNIKANLIRFGVQPDIGFISKYFSASFSARVVSLNYMDVNGNLIFGSINQVNYLNANKSSFLIEPALTLRAGLENIKLQLQIAESFNLSNSDFSQDKSLITLGLNLNLR